MSGHAQMIFPAFDVDLNFIGLPFDHDLYLQGRLLWEKSCEAWTTARPCCAHGLTIASGVGNIFTERNANLPAEQSCDGFGDRCQSFRRNLPGRLPFSG